MMGETALKNLDQHLVNASISDANRYAIRVYSLGMCRVPGSNIVMKELVATELMSSSLNLAVNVRRLIEWYEIREISLSPDPHNLKEHRENIPEKYWDALNYFIHQRTCNIA